MSTIDEYLNILGINGNFKNSPKDKQEKILAAAWRKFSKKWHPDINRSPIAEINFKLGNEANEKLKEYIRNNTSEFTNQDGSKNDNNTRYYQSDDYWNKYDYSGSMGSEATVFKKVLIAIFYIVLASCFIIAICVTDEDKAGGTYNQSTLPKEEEKSSAAVPVPESSAEENIPETPDLPEEVSESESNTQDNTEEIKEPDFMPYMEEIQHRLGGNWDVYKTNENYRIVVLFKVNKGGQLMSVEVQESSGITEADTKAINAVKLSAPFDPLPSDFKGNEVDIQFTFSYNTPKEED